MNPATGLDLDVLIAGRDVSAHLSVEAGHTLALLGPNGAGKSTLLAAAAGLIRPTEGTVRIGEQVASSTQPQSWQPPHHRHVGLLAQDARLFPHLNAVANVEFGLRAHNAPERLSRKAIRAKAERYLDEVGMAAYGPSKPHELSGGQAQRVAIARALATEPKVLLLDEPLRALDVDVARDIRALLRAVTAERTAVIVTHDVVDAALLADRIAVMEGGRVVDDGPSARVLARPRSDFGARFAGLNLVRGVAESADPATTALRMPDGRLLVGVAEAPLASGAAVAAVIAPSAVSVHLRSSGVPQGSPRNHLVARVVDLEPSGSLVRVRTDGLTAEVTPSAAAELALTPGAEVVLTVKAAEVHIEPSI